MALSVGPVQLREKFYLIALYGRNLICVLRKIMYFSDIEFFSQFCSN